MRKIIAHVLFLITIMIPYSAHAILSMELTRGVAGAIPIAIVPFSQADSSPQNVSNIIAMDLQNSGRFKVFGGNSLSEHPTNAAQISADYFRRLGTDNVVIGSVTPVGGNQYQVSFQLVDMLSGKSIAVSKQYAVSANELRSVAHHISDLIYQHITGIRGVFSTKLVYVVVQRSQGHPRYVLEVADQDGYNPRTLLSSPEPIMSPSWSPNGRQIAYVSFENRQSGIYVQDVATGARHLVSQYKGINGAPSWSPDGRKLALVLSKSGSPNIYLLDLGSRKLTQLTNDFYINTEPSWSPNGRSLIFTSNRSGSLPQLYQLNVANHAVSRVTYDGDYNARGCYTKDGNHIAMIHRVGGVYKIGILDLDNGTTRVLNNAAGDSASPSVAPNGTMVLYDTVYHGQNMLGMVSTDGTVQLVLPARNGEAQDPAWSPFMG